MIWWEKVFINPLSSELATCDSMPNILAVGRQRQEDNKCKVTLCGAVNLSQQGNMRPSNNSQDLIQKAVTRAGTQQQRACLACLRALGSVYYSSKIEPRKFSTDDPGTGKMAAWLRVNVTITVGPRFDSQHLRQGPYNHLYTSCSGTHSLCPPQVPIFICT